MAKVKHNSFKGKKTALAFFPPPIGIERDVYTADETVLAPFLNRALNADAQRHILSFLEDMEIHTAYYEDSMFYDEQAYCDKEYDDDFTIYDLEQLD